MRETAVSPASTAEARGLREPWIHRTAAGTEIGPDLSPGSVAAFVSSAAITWELRETLWVLVLKDFKARYRAQSLGLFWSLAYPLVMMVTLTVAFGYVLRIQIPNFSVFYLVGAVFWQFFTNGSLAGVTSILENGSLVKKTMFRRFLFPIASVLSHLIHLGMELVLLFLFYFVFPHAYTFNVTLVALPFLVLLEVVLLTGMALITSTMNVRYRDTYYLVSSLMTVGFWATPVIYASQMAPPWAQRWLRLNPITGIIESARSVIMRGEWPSAQYLLPATGIAIAMFFVGCLVFHSQNVRVSDYV